MAAYLVPRIREVPPKSSTLTGGIASQYIQYLTKPKAYGQIISVRACIPPATVLRGKNCYCPHLTAVRAGNCRPDRLALLLLRACKPFFGAGAAMK